MSSGSSTSHQLAQLKELFPALNISALELVYKRNNGDFDATLDHLLTHGDNIASADFATDKNYISTDAKEREPSPISLQENKYLDNRDSMGRLIEDEISDIALILTSGANLSDSAKNDQNSKVNSRPNSHVPSTHNVGNNGQGQFESDAARRQEISGQKYHNRNSQLKPKGSNISDKLRTSATNLNLKTSKSFNMMTSSIRRTWSNLRDRLSMDDKFDFDEPDRKSNRPNDRTKGNSKHHQPKLQHQKVSNQYQRNISPSTAYIEDISVSKVAEAMVNPFATVSELDTGDFVLEEEGDFRKKSPNKAQPRAQIDEGEKSWYSADNPHLTIVDLENSFTLAGSSNV